jgi:hypothetical protein
LISGNSVAGQLPQKHEIHLRLITSNVLEHVPGLFVSLEINVLSEFACGRVEDDLVLEGQQGFAH